MLCLLVLKFSSMESRCTDSIELISCDEWCYTGRFRPLYIVPIRFYIRDLNTFNKFILMHIQRIFYIPMSCLACIFLNLQVFAVIVKRSLIKMGRGGREARYQTRTILGPWGSNSWELTICTQQI